MAVTPRIFISATSGDLKSHRATVAAALKKLETYAEVQDDWPPDYRTVQAMLRKRIKDCDAVIHLAGLRYGAEPRDLPPGVPRRSYTQMEYHLAREMGKPVYIFLLPDTFPYDDASLPEDEEKRALQLAHRALIKADPHLRNPAQNEAELREAVLSLQPLVEKLRTALRRQRLYQTGGIAALLCLTGGIGWAAMREKKVNQEQGHAIAELQRPETVEVKYFKEIQALRSSSPRAAIAQSGGGTAQAEQMSYADALAAVAEDHGLTAEILRAQLDAFATRVLADPKADSYQRAVAEFHRQNYAAAITLATAAAEAADHETKAQRQKSIDAWTLVGDSEKQQVHYREALAAYQKALKAGDKEGDPKQWSDLAMAVANLQDTLADYQAAEPLHNEILSLREKEYGHDAPETASALNNLATLLQATNRLTEAEPLLRRALLIDEASLGKDHPNVATALNNLAQLLQATSRLPEAEHLMRRSLDILAASLGKGHPNVAIALSNLAGLLQGTNRLAEAEPLLRGSLVLSEASFGKDHPEVAIRLNNLAQLLKDTNRLAEAEPLLRRALGILVDFIVQTGHRHPHLDDAIKNYRSLLTKMGDPEAVIEEKLGKLLEPIRKK